VKKIFLLLALLLPLAAPAPAQTSDSGKLAWTVQPANGGPAFTILGSAAFLGVESYPLPDYMQAAYAKSAALLVESDFNSLHEPAFGEKVAAAMRLPEGKTLASESSTAFRKAMFDRCDELKLDPGTLNLQSLQPWGAGLVIFAAANAKIGLEGRYALDQAVYTMAKVDGKPVLTLESPQQVYDLMTSWPEGSPKEEFARQLMAEQTLVSQNLTQLRAAWKRGDLAYLEAQLPKSYANFPGLRQRLLTARAKDWSERLAKGKPLPANTLAVLPLIYLIGPEGLLAELEAKGGTVNRLR
jgi:uncharacterized protein YbaP (TraB family)